MSEENKGKKFDNNKQQWYRMPLSVLKPLADVYCIAGAKYPAFNCLQEFDNGNARFWDGMMRHLEASQLNPLAINEEDGGVYHLAQVAFNALHRLDQALRYQKEQEKIDIKFLKFPITTNELCDCGHEANYHLDIKDSMFKGTGKCGHPNCNCENFK